METRAILRGVRLSAQKGRLVADMIRDKPVDKALSILAFTPKKGAALVKKVHVERGAVLKRFHARAKGRGTRVTKQTCHIYITVGD